MALVNLGWIWFRANSLVEARQMFEALVSPRSYGTHMLNGSLYLLVASLAAIYAIVLSVNDWVDRYAAGMAVGPISSAELATVLIRDRWIWIGPMWAIACVLVSLLIPHQSRGTNVFMYRMF
jgi:hypothetical protein